MTRLLNNATAYPGLETVITVLVLGHRIQQCFYIEQTLAHVYPIAAGKQLWCRHFHAVLCSCEGDTIGRG